VTDPVFPGTPLYRCEALERALGCSLSIKPGTANPVRSFKARGTEVAGSPATAPRAVAGGSNVSPLGRCSPPSTGPEPGSLRTWPPERSAFRVETGPAGR
jgi:hypothetical protein